jgi:hypothetical protein
MSTPGSRIARFVRSHPSVRAGAARLLSRTLRLGLLLFAALGPSCLPPPSPPWDRDRDGDGYPESVDCWDDDQTWSCSGNRPQDVHPGADETCNGIDDDCDDLVDEGAVDTEVVGFQDLDGDGHGNPDAAIWGCPDTSWWASGEPDPPGDDCDDQDAASHPEAPELCWDPADNDCDGRADADDPDCADADDDDDATGPPDDDDSAPPPPDDDDSAPPPPDDDDSAPPPADDDSASP